MQRPKLVLSLALAVVVGAALSLQAFAAGEKAPAGKVVIKACQKKKPPVPFDHGAHVKLMKEMKWKGECQACHHLVDGKPPKQHACASCHAKPQGSLGTCADMSLKKNPFHVNCIDCHKNMVKAGKAKAPTKCAGCHTK